MQIVRLTLRLPLLLVMSGVMCGLRLVVWPTALLSERLDRRLRRALLQTWNRLFAFIAGIRVECRGPRPALPFFLVANHLSYLDMLVLCHQTGCIFVSREDVEHWPVIGFMSRSLYIIFIDRASRRDTKRVNGLISHALEMGDGIVIFPESHITRGIDIDPFKSSLIEPACAAGIPVWYATLNYRTLPGDAPASEVVAWWRPESFFYHLQRLLRQRGVVATVYFGETPLQGADRKELAPRLREAVLRNFTPLV